MPKDKESSKKKEKPEAKSRDGKKEKVEDDGLDRFSISTKGEIDVSKKGRVEDLKKGRVDDSKQDEEDWKKEYDEDKKVNDDDDRQGKEERRKKEKGEDGKKGKDKDGKKKKGKDNDDENDKDKKKGKEKDDDENDNKDEKKEKDGGENAKDEKKGKEKNADDEKGKDKKKKLKKKKEVDEQRFSDVLMKAFLPFRIILMILGRYPLTQTRHGPSDYEFRCALYALPAIHFIFSTALLFYILLIGTWNLFVVVMDINIPTIPQPELQKRELLFEKIVIERHLVIFIVTWTSLIHSCIVSVNILLKREYMANYFDFWTRAADKMYMDVARGVYNYSVVICSVFMAMMLILFILSLFRIGPSTVGGPTIVFMLMFRHMIPYPWIDKEQPAAFGLYERTIFQIVGGCFFLFIVISSKIYILLFLFKCKLLRNAFANWNGRVYAAVLRGGDFIQSDRGRTTYSLLFKDHCILLDLLEGTDRLFSTIIESYFGLQVVTICFEGYFFIRTAKWSSKQDAAAEDGTFFIRPYDYLPGLVILVQSILILIIVSKAAAEVGEEALAGLEVIRRKTMLGRRTDEELYFMLSMFSSYTAYKKLQLSGGGYFYLDKEFIIGIVSTIFSYFIITYQFQPTLDFTPTDEVTRCHIGLFLENFEGLDPYHWVAKGQTPAPCPPLIFAPVPAASVTG